MVSILPNKKKPPPVRCILNPLYRFYCVFLGIDIPYQTQIGEGFKISHPSGIVINENAIIGNNVWIRCNTVIGNNVLSKNAPNIGDNVSIGANVCIIGNITIGHDTIIGAGSVVVKDIPPYSIVVGNPGKVVRTINRE